MSLFLESPMVEGEGVRPQGFRTIVLAFAREYRALFVGLVLAQLVVYSYFFTTLIFTTHTFPNSFVYPYPSFKTSGEGRWFGDLIIWFQGGSGVQPFQMVLGVALQAVNGILFARLSGLSRRVDVGLAAAFVCLYPAFLDGWSFAMDHLFYALGDSAAIAALLYWSVTPRSFKSAVIVTVVFVLVLATYQPKIAFVALLSIVVLVREIAEGRGSRQFSGADAVRSVAILGVIFASACALYWLSEKVTVSGDFGARSYVNQAGEAARAALDAYPQVLLAYARGDYLPAVLKTLPTLSIVLGGAALIFSAYRRHIGACAFVIILLLLIPVALRASYIINRNSWEYAGRITFVNGYALLFFLSRALQVGKLRRLGIAILAVFLYFFVVVGTQETNAATLKTIYEVNMINRVAARVEEVTPDLYQKEHALVVIGQLPPFPRRKFARYQNLGVEVQAETFTDYRQPEILNYFIGVDALKRPTAAQVERATASSEPRRPWPATESVYVMDDVVVVLLEKYRPGMMLTWSEGMR